MSRTINGDMPAEALKKHEKFCSAYKVYFKSQKQAEKVLKVTQTAISRYLSGKVYPPAEVAYRLAQHTKNRIQMDDIWFDINAYMFDEKKHNAN